MENIIFIFKYFLKITIFYLMIRLSEVFILCSSFSTFLLLFFRIFNGDQAGSAGRPAFIKDQVSLK